MFSFWTHHLDWGGGVFARRRGFLKRGCVEYGVQQVAKRNKHALTLVPYVERVLASALGEKPKSHCAWKVPFLACFRDPAQTCELVVAAAQAVVSGLVGSV